MKNFFIFLFIAISLNFISLSPSRLMANNQYGIDIPAQTLRAQTDSFYYAHMDTLPFWNKNVEVIRQVEKPYQAPSKTASFYLVLLLLMTLGVLRMAFPTYFRHLYNSFMSPMSNKRALREQIEQNTAANTAMNIFFCISLGLFVFIIITQRSDILKETRIAPNLILIGSILMAGLVYFIKFAILKLIGWAFKVSQVTNDYLFNVFLINKILGVALLPFSIILAFGEGNWLNLIFVIAIILGIILLLNRYTRSWSSLASFFQFSKLHFFMYFCASELLPLAILAKFTYNILM